MGVLVAEVVTRALVVIAFVAALVVPRLARADMPSPGPLSAGHAALDTDDACGKCHDSGASVSAQLCLACHRDLGAEMASGQGLHGKQYRGKACESCHTEHAGRGTRIVQWPGGAMERLDHDQTGWRLEGGHQTAKCLACHTRKSRLNGAPVFLGTPTTCARCHADPHANRFSAQCASCHDVVAWKDWEQKPFNHNLARYPLTGKHVSVTCAKCHGTPQKWKPLAFGTCDACHADPHEGQFRPTPCAQCHTTAGWTTSEDVIKRNHPGLSLANGHATVGCRTCHDRGNDKPPTKGSTCVACHPNVHIARFGNRCEGCHASIKWVGLPESIGREAHGKTRYPLDGRHQTASCNGCHPRSKPQAERYKRLRFDTCGACHADSHKGEFKSFGGGECAQCHTVDGFSPTTFGPAQHAQTGYTLDGKHAATPCAACHPGARPRLAWKIEKSQCADCHANPHGDQFAKEMQTGGCAHCHTPYDWNQAKVDHSTFPLTGAHARTSCEACHGAQKQGAAPEAFRGIPRTCDGCHDDVHAGQFRTSEPVKACDACHTTETFKIAAFDHDKTRYPLDGAHVKLACDQCHPKTTLADGSTAVRYRLGYFHCKDCHANPHRSTP